MVNPLFTNRLIHEKSPYLLQHAHNPVDWYPWSKEAFNEAKEQDRPIFLSIGYASCHWCHVMEEESFANVEVAQLMNDNFINIKVDREELPEVDGLYMEFAQAMMSGGAGWPLNMILTPDLMPFFASTYLPPDTKEGYLGLKQLILRIREIWADREERENVMLQATKIVELLSYQPEVIEEGLPTTKMIEEAVEILLKSADPLYGGSKGAPKFPMGFQSAFLLRYAKQKSDSRSLFYVERTLSMMARGGIFDQLGGGFSRYATDEKWITPHFEKMLYDNAILVRCYFELFNYTRKEFYREIGERTLDYIFHRLYGKDGAFFSAEDADSKGIEGAYYTWSWEEVQKVLGHDAHVFSEIYGVTAVGNFQGRNILYVAEPVEEFAARHRVHVGEVQANLASSRKKMWEEREKRAPLRIDDKVICSWNGLMIHALVQAAEICGQPKYLAIGEKAALFIKEHLWTGEQLFRRFREGEAKHEGCLDDYVFMIQAALSLFEADCSSSWLHFAMQLTEVVQDQFKGDQGSYYVANGNDPYLLFRRSEYYDGAEPSGNAVHAENLIKLYQITSVEAYLQGAESILKAAKQHVELYPPAACYHLMALMRYLDKGAPTFIIALNDKEEYKEEIKAMLAGQFIPHKAVIFYRNTDEELRDLVTLTRHYAPIQGKTALYVCNRDRCHRPVTSLSDMWKIIEKF